jgi:hypothetical protein
VDALQDMEEDLQNILKAIVPVLNASSKICRDQTLQIALRIALPKLPDRLGHVGQLLREFRVLQSARGVMKQEQGRFKSSSKAGNTICQWRGP